MKDYPITKIVEYESRFKEDFKHINQLWIEKYFTMEDSDRKSLDFPEENILQKGGAILMAVADKKAVGTCALIKMEGKPYDYELAKMGVLESHRGMKIGLLLGEAILEKAKQLGAKNLYLESNRILAPAINLYKKLGFEEIKGKKSPYERCNIQMELYF